MQLYRISNFKSQFPHCNRGSTTTLQSTSIWNFTQMVKVGRKAFDKSQNFQIWLKTHCFTHYFNHNSYYNPCVPTWYFILQLKVLSLITYVDAICKLQNLLEKHDFTSKSCFHQCFQLARS
jgi:hypothetical protein